MAVIDLRTVTSAAGMRYTVYVWQACELMGDGPWVGKVRRSDGSVEMESAELSLRGAGEWMARAVRQIEAQHEGRKRRRVVQPGVTPGYRGAP